jgi:hypothetical protein
MEAWRIRWRRRRGSSRRRARCPRGRSRRQADARRCPLAQTAQRWRPNELPARLSVRAVRAQGGDGGGGYGEVEGPAVGPLPGILCIFRSRVRVSTFHLPFRFEIEFPLLFSYPRLDLHTSMALVPLIDYGNHLNAYLVGYGTLTVYVYKCDACMYREMGEGELPSPAGGCWNR